MGMTSWHDMAWHYEVDLLEMQLAIPNYRIFPWSWCATVSPSTVMAGREKFGDMFCGGRRSGIKSRESMHEFPFSRLWLANIPCRDSYNAKIFSS